MNKTTNNTTYLNPFCISSKTKNDWQGQNSKLFRKYKGVEVYRPFDNTYDYVKNGIVIAQRCGFSKDLIDSFCDISAIQNEIDLFYASRMHAAYQKGFNFINCKDISNE